MKNLVDPTPKQLKAESDLFTLMGWEGGFLELFCHHGVTWKNFPIRPALRKEIEDIVKVLKDLAPRMDDVSGLLEESSAEVPEEEDME
jgi:hypothetical protein